MIIILSLQYDIVHYEFFRKGAEKFPGLEKTLDKLEPAASINKDIINFWNPQCTSEGNPNVVR